MHLNARQSVIIALNAGAAQKQQLRKRYRAANGRRQAAAGDARELMGLSPEARIASGAFNDTTQQPFWLARCSSSRQVALTSAEFEKASSDKQLAEIWPGFCRLSLPSYNVGMSKVVAASLYNRLLFQHDEEALIENG